MVTTRWGTQVMGAPVIDHIISVAVFDRQALTPVELMVWARATFVPLRIDVRASLILRTIRLVCLVAGTIRLPCLVAGTIRLPRLVAGTIRLPCLVTGTIRLPCLVTGTILLAVGQYRFFSEGKSSHGQRHRNDA